MHVDTGAVLVDTGVVLVNRVAVGAILVKVHEFSVLIEISN